MNLPNKLTLVRIALIPLCLVCWGLGWPLLAAALFGALVFPAKKEEESAQ